MSEWISLLATSSAMAQSKNVSDPKALTVIAWAKIVTAGGDLLSCAHHHR